MDFVGRAVFHLGSFALLFGLLIAVVPLFGLTRRDGLLAVGLGLALAALGPQISSKLKAEMAANAATKEQEARRAAVNEAALAASKPVQLTKQQMLVNLSVDSLLWEKGGFGSVMLATFMIQNNNPARVKDVRVTCGVAANSGTWIGATTRTIYESIDQKSYIYVHDMNMGFIDSQANRSKCIVTDFATG